MQKMKEGFAVVLTATMVVGSSITVFAADTTPGGNGTTHGTGSSEGHVDTEKLNVILPTIPADSEPFAYTMDPERLIQATGNAKYEDFTFPDKDSDTGVYFKIGEKEFDNTSNTLQVINKSSCNVTISVDVQATASAGGNDIDLATAVPGDSDTGAKLYLELSAGKTKQAVSTTKATLSKTISGQSDNFEIVYKDNAYKYEEKGTPAKPWKAMNISMTGAVNNKAITAETTAPAVNVTWSWTKAADSATVDTVDEVDYSDNAGPSVTGTSFTMTDNTSLEIPFSLGVGDLAAEGISALLWGGDALAEGSQYTIANNKLTIEAGVVDFLKSQGTPQKVTIVFADEEQTSVEITLN